MRATLSELTRREQTHFCEAFYAGASWAAGASFPVLLTLANEPIEELALQPEQLRGVLKGLTDPHDLAGDFWGELHVGTGDPSPAWFVSFWHGAFSEFRASFEAGRYSGKQQARAA